MLSSGGREERLLDLINVKAFFQHSLNIFFYVLICGAVIFNFMNGDYRYRKMKSDKIRWPL